MRTWVFAGASALALALACADDGDGVASNAGGGSGTGGASAGGGSTGGAPSGGGADGGDACSLPSQAGAHSPAALGTSLAKGSLRTPDAIWDPVSGRYVVLFGSVNPSGAFRTRVLTTRWDAGAFVTGPELELADPALPTTDSLERALVRSEGASPKILALLEDTRASGDPAREVMGQFLSVSADGAVIEDGGSFSVTQLPNQHEYTPSAAWDAGAGVYFVSWSDDREEKTVKDGRLVYGRTVGNDGSLGPEVRLGGTSLWQTGASVAGSGGGGRFLVAWGDYDLGPGIDAGYRARVVDAKGQPLGPPLELARYGDHIYDPVSVAWQPCKQAWLVAWMKQEKIYGSWVSFEGKLLENDLVLGEHAEGAGAARLIWAPATRSFALSFHAWKTENAWVQELDAAGGRVGSPKNVNAAKPSLGTFWHPLAARPDRAEFVVFPSLNYAEQTASAFVGPG